MARSIIYSHIKIYRVTMQLLYGGKYYARYEPIKKILTQKKIQSVTELCFGDTVIADFCRKNSIVWNGIDSNEKFVQHAVKKGYSARCEKINEETKIPSCDAILIMGSLYHFGTKAEALLVQCLQVSTCIIINEPVKNLSGGTGQGSKLAARLSNAGNGPEYFRFTTESLTHLVETICNKSNYKYYIAHTNQKEITFVIEHN